MLSGSLRASHKFSHDIDSKRQIEIDLAVRRLRDACKTYKADEWKPKLQRYAMPAGPRGKFTSNPPLRVISKPLLTDCV